jgi:hypothetical protein
LRALKGWLIEGTMNTSNLVTNGKKIDTKCYFCDKKCFQVMATSPPTLLTLTSTLRCRFYWIWRTVLIKLSYKIKLVLHTYLILYIKNQENTTWSCLTCIHIDQNIWVSIKHRFGNYNKDFRKPESHFCTEKHQQ